MKRSKIHPSGQSLLMAVFILVTLLICIPAIVFVSRMVSSHNSSTQKRLKANSVAQEGVALGIQQLSSAANWPYLNGGALPAAGSISSAQGSAFSITYTSAPNYSLQPYQVGLLVRPMDSRYTPPVPISGSAILAVISQKTVGLKLPMGMGAGAALDLARVPVENNGSTLRVEFGPVIVRDVDTSVWTLDTSMSTSQRPRKFSSGGIAPRCTDPTGATCAASDRKEYWAYTSPGFSTYIDTGTYIGYAQASNCNPVAANCYFNGPTTFPTPFRFIGGGTGSIYVIGNATFNPSTVVVASSGAVIVTGNLTLAVSSNPASGYSPTTNVSIPPTQAVEDPYCKCADALCASGAVDRHVDFRGFLYVQGNMTVSAGTNWTINGVLRVDGTLTLGANSTLDVIYDDGVNHRIRTSNFDIQVDTMTNIL